MAQFKASTYKLIIPCLITAFTGTFTYPIAVRIARRVFKLKGFYQIHFSIAPFLALFHVNVFGLSHAYCRIKLMEADFEDLKHLVQADYDYQGYYKLKKLITTSGVHKYARGKFDQDKFDVLELAEELGEQDKKMGFELA